VLSATDDELLAWLSSHVPVKKKIEKFVPAEKKAEFINTIRDNIVMPEDAGFWAEVIFTNELAYSGDALSVIKEAGTSFFQAAAKVLPENDEDFKKFSRATGEKTNKKGKNLFMPLRAALTGRTQGPEMAKMWHLLGAERMQTRLATALELTKENQ